MIDYELQIDTEPEVEPVTLLDVKNHLPVYDSAADGPLNQMITAARKYLESRCGRTFITTIYLMYLDRFPDSDETGGCFYRGRIVLPRSPLQSLDTITYIASDGTETAVTPGQGETWNDNGFNIGSRRNPGMIEPAYGYTWPSTREQMDAVTLEFTGGYGDDATDVPDAAKLAIKLLVGHLWEFNSPVVTNEVANLLPLQFNELVAQLQTGYRL